MNKPRGKRGGSALMPRPCSTQAKGPQGTRHGGFLKFSRFRPRKKYMHRNDVAKQKNI
jgi:hypothetical protein